MMEQVQMTQGFGSDGITPITGQAAGCTYFFKKNLFFGSYSIKIQQILLLREYRLL